MKELNVFQKVILKIGGLFNNSWLNFSEQFPKPGQLIQIKITFDTGSFGGRVFISESFEWCIDEKDKEKWLDGLSYTQWRSK